MTRVQVRIRGVVQGDPAALEAFLAGVRSETPALARIEEILVSQVTPLGEHDFLIRKSLANPPKG